MPTFPQICLLGFSILNSLTWLIDPYAKYVKLRVVLAPGIPGTWKSSNKVMPHDGVIKWKHYPRYWSFVRRIHRSPVNSPNRPVTRSFDVFVDLRPNKRLSKQWWGWWFETPSRQSWHHCDWHRVPWWREFKIPLDVVRIFSPYYNCYSMALIQQIIPSFLYNYRYPFQIKNVRL